MTFHQRTLLVFITSKLDQYKAIKVFSFPTDIPTKRACTLIAVKILESLGTVYYSVQGEFNCGSYKLNLKNINKKNIFP